MLELTRANPVLLGEDKAMKEKSTQTTEPRWQYAKSKAPLQPRGWGAMEGNQGTVSGMAEGDLIMQHVYPG